MGQAGSHVEGCCTGPALCTQLLVSLVPYLLFQTEGITLSHDVIMLLRPCELSDAGSKTSCLVCAQLCANIVMPVVLEKQSIKSIYHFP